GDGGTECQLEDGRWTCSEPCWEKAGGYGPDLSPAEGETSDGSEQAAIEIADAVIAWMVRHDLLDADQEYRDDDIIAVLDELSPGLATTNDEAFASPLAAPSNPVISDEWQPIETAPKGQRLIVSNGKWFGPAVPLSDST